MRGHFLIRLSDGSGETLPGETFHAEVGAIGVAVDPQAKGVPEWSATGSTSASTGSST